MTSASFNLLGNSDLIRQILNIVYNASEQMFLEDRSCWGILFKVVVFLGLIRFSFLFISDKPTSLNENLAIFFFLWNQMLFKDSVFFIVSKSFLTANLSSFKEKKVVYFSKNFYCH